MSHELPHSDNARCAVSNAPRLSMRRITESNSGAVISRIGRLPIHGNISFSSLPMILLEWFSSQLLLFLNFSNHSLVVRSIKTVTHQTTPRSNLFQRNTTGEALISSMPFMIRAFSSSMEHTHVIPNYPPIPTSIPAET